MDSARPMNGGNLTITDSTLAGNVVQGITYIVDGDGNYASDCWGGVAIADTRSSTLTLTNSTLADNPGEAVLYGDSPCCGAATQVITATNTIIQADGTELACDLRSLLSGATVVDLGGNVFQGSGCVPPPTSGAGGTPVGGAFGAGGTAGGGTGGAAAGTGLHLGSPGNYGGPTLTINLLSGSSALGHGVTRPATACDSGAWQH